MKRFILLIAAFSIVSIVFAQDQTTFILVRHAEKADDGTRNPPLNEVGKERALNLAALLENQDIAALYSTPYKRTQETLQPLAQKKGLETSEYKPRAGADWLAKLYGDHSGGTVVIVGHSNTIPNLANHLLGNETFTQFDEKEYSNLIVIVGSEVGNGKLVRLSF
ncbi:MAG: phosphoglycerate mutase family protein [Cyclobacteriaceae bacterium]